MRLSPAVAMFLLATATALAQGISLDRLNNCGDMRATDLWLSGKATSAPETCRAPRDALERRLLSNWASSLASHDSLQSCMTRAPTLASLAGFECMVSRRNSKPVSFFCFRRVNHSPLLAYRENYAQVYARRVAGYFEQSATCDAVLQAGHKASIAGVSLPSTEMLSIARPAFAYESRLRTSASDRRVEHGFAFTDPALAAGGKTGIEYVAARNELPRNFDRMIQGSLRAGEWTVDAARITDVVALTNDMAKGDAALANSLKGASEAAALLDIGGLYLSVTSPNRSGRGEAEKAGLRKAWAGKLGDVLRSWKLAPVSGAELRRQGLDPETLSSNIAIALPYGLRAAEAVPKLSFAGAWGGENASCGADHGGYLVLALEVPPTPGKRSEFGTFALSVIAVSSCRKSSGGPGVDALMSRLAAAFAKSISGSQP